MFVALAGFNHASRIGQKALALQSGSGQAWAEESKPMQNVGMEEKRFHVIEVPLGGLS